MEFPKNMIVTIDDRLLLFALDRLYREAMQRFERTTLLLAARSVAKVLRIAVSNLAPEGYYATDAALTEYFRLMRALQDVSESREHEVAGVPEFQQLWDVANSRIYGHPDRSGKLLPKGIDALGRVLLLLRPEWTVARLVPAARAAAIETDDYSLVGLAARVEDAVLLTAVRESVVLYAHSIALGRIRWTFNWRVDPDLAREANRFVQAFNALVPDALPAVVPANAPLFYEPKWHVTQVTGRCVRLGFDPESRPIRHYHWAICETRDSESKVQEFWADQLWTTERYLAQRTRSGHCVDPEFDGINHGMTA